MIVVEAAPALLLWAAVALRHRHMADHAQRGLWWALLALAAATTINIGPIAAWIDGLPTTAANFSSLAKHCLVVAAAQQAYEVVRGLALHAGQAEAGLRRRQGGAALVVVVLAVLFLASPADNQTADFTETYALEPLIGLFWLTYLTYLGTVLASVMRTAWWYRSTLLRTPLRAGTSLLGIGAGVGLTYVLVKASYVGSVHLDQQLGLTISERMAAIEGAATPLLLSGSMVCIVLGVAWPRLGARPRVRQLLAGLDHARLHGLWREVTAAAPEVSLDRAVALSARHSPGAPARSGRLAGAHEGDLLLYRRVVEILDARLDLLRYVDDVTTERAAYAVAPLSLSKQRRCVVAERVELELALRAKRAGGSVLRPSPARASSPARSLPEEVAHLRDLSAAGRTARRIADDLAHEPAGQSGSLSR